MRIIVTRPHAHKRFRMEDNIPTWPSFALPGTTVVLRPWQPGDAPALYEAATASIESVGRWLPWCRPGYTMADSEAWIETTGLGWRQGELFGFALADVASGEIVGGAGLNQIHREHRSANLGYWVREGHQGHGLASAAVRPLARFGFGQLGLVRLEIVCALENIASRRCAEKAGASFEGVARHRLMVGNTPTDAAVYALLPEDLTSEPAPQPAEQSSTRSS